MDRYPDVKAEFGKLAPGEMLTKVNEHFKDKGQKENRNGEMAERITKQQAQCYLNKYPDLKKAFGSDTHSWIKA
jgi:hypothetical protein